MLLFLLDSLLLSGLTLTWFLVSIGLLHFLLFSAEYVKQGAAFNPRAPPKKSPKKLVHVRYYFDSNIMVSKPETDQIKAKYQCELLDLNQTSNVVMPMKK